MSRRDRQFSSVRTEGGLLPQDVLSRIQAGDKDLPGLTPADYHLGAHERIGEAVNRAWSRLTATWHAFQEALSKEPDSSLATGLTRDRWLLPLFEELRYGRLPKGQAIEVEGKSFAVSHTWHRSPIHLLGVGVDLDRRQAGVAGAAKASPHGLVQEFLNRSEEHRWGFVSNGLRLRILRDHHSLTRQAYVEFDLQAIMEGEQYSEFLLLWMVCHQSRVEADKPEDCWLETWFNTSREQGVRALDKLRGGVEKAIEAFGTGFLANRANTKLLQALESGELDKQEYYRQLLRLVYRLIFLFVAEERGALLNPDADELAKARYLRFYATRRLRELADKRRGGPHSDLWQGLRLVMSKLDDGCPDLALPALGSRLWGPTACPWLMDAECANEHLLDAVRRISTIEEGRTRYAVNWRNVGADELGSIYEGLLELHPRMNKEAGTFELDTAAGHERKTTGSYYTPTELVDCLLESALDPVLDEASRKPDPEAAILNLKVCDPACGSGHFLVAAARRIAKRLAAVRAGEDEPSPREVQRALRDVVGRCIYGVDLNPMAVELCKVSLWMEAIEPGRPLSFLDSHIQCGNALIGTTPAQMARGIHDGAFKAIAGDDKEVASRLKAQNKREREAIDAGQATMFAAFDKTGREDDDALAERTTALEGLLDDDINTLRVKEERWESLRRSPEFRDAWFRADAWCAAFVWPKKAGDLASAAITEERWHRISRDTSTTTPLTRRTVRGLASHLGLFHWHLAFAQVFGPLRKRFDDDDTTGWTSGFDVVLSNPPWVSYTGRQRAEASGQFLHLLCNSFPSVARWPASHPAFMVLCAHVLAPGGRAGLVLPKQVADLEAYGNARAAVMRVAHLASPIIDAGEDAFPGVTQSVGLFSLVAGRDGPIDPVAPWPLAQAPFHAENVKRGGTEPDSQSPSDRIMAQIASILSTAPRFEPKTFADPGVHTGNVSKKIIFSAHVPGAPGYGAVREGRNIAAFLCGPPVKWLWTTPDLAHGEYCTIRNLDRYRGVPILLRQTANRPIAARHREPTYFRNSLLACFGVSNVQDTVVLAFLNSALYALLHRKAVRDSNQKAFPQVKIRHLHALPAVPVRALDRPYEGRRLSEALNAAVLEAEASATAAGRACGNALERIERMVLLAFDLDPDLAPQLLEMAQ